MPPIEVHEPAPGQRVDVDVTPNQPLTLDFNPLDAQAILHGDDLTLTFADGGVVVLHHISQHGVALPTALQLPDGTIIDACELLQALPGEQVNPAAGKIPNEKIPLEEINPTAGPQDINPAAGPSAGAHPVVTNFTLPGLGNGLTPLGGLPPEGSFTTTGFPPPGAGGFPPGPPAPPGPPVPPHFLSMIEDLHPLDYPATTTTGNVMTDSFFGHSIVISEPPAQVDSYVFWQPGSVVVDPATDPAGVAPGLWGSLNMQTNGSYSYTLNATGIAAGSQLSADILSQELSNPGTPDTPYPLLDLFTVTVDNGFDTASQQLAMYTVATNIMPNETTASVSGTTAGAPVLLTYTDLADPAHSFQELVTVGSTGLITADGAPIQPHDAALVTLEYEGTSTIINGFSVGGETFTGLAIPLDAGDQALTTIINPDLSGFGDTGDTGLVLIAPTGYTNDSSGAGGTFLATSAGQYVFENPGNPGVTLGVTPDMAADQTGAVLNLGSNTGHEIGGLGSDVLVDNGVAGVTYNGTAGMVINGAPTENGTLTFFVDNANLTHGVEAVTINVTTGETADAMASALASAINLDTNLTNATFGLSADYVGGDLFQIVQTPGSQSFESLTQFEGLALSASGNPPAETISGQTGIDTLRFDTSGNAIDMTQTATLNQFANIDVVDLTAAASGPAATNSLTLDASSVLQLTANENAAIPTYTGGNAMWVEGTANDSVTLNGFTQISSAITSSTQLPIVQTSSAGQPPLTSASQMVGFAEYAGAANGQTVHVYVANAIVNAGHVTVH